MSRFNRVFFVKHCDNIIFCVIVLMSKLGLNVVLHVSREKKKKKRIKETLSRLEIVYFRSYHERITNRRGGETILAITSGRIVIFFFFSPENVSQVSSEFSERFQRFFHRFPTAAVHYYSLRDTLCFTVTITILWRRVTHLHFNVFSRNFRPQSPPNLYCNAPYLHSLTMKNAWQRERFLHFYAAYLIVIFSKPLSLPVCL